MNQRKLPTVCIVGSGPGGGIAAIELARTKLFKVILVDVDKLDQSFSSLSMRSELSSINMGNPFGQPVTRGFGFGGSSNLWHGVLTELDDQDWEPLDAISNKKISREVKSYYQKLDLYFGKKPNTNIQQLRKRISRQSLYRSIEMSGKFISKDFFLQNKPLRLRNHLAACKTNGLPIEFMENAVAITIDSGDEDGEVIRGLLVDVQGEKLRIEADYFILSAGALETPRIMLQSIYENKIKVANKHVGANLVDHPWTVIGAINSKNGWFKLGLTDVFLSSRTKYRVGYRLLSAVTHPEIGKNHCISIKPVFFGDYSEFKESLKAIMCSGNSIGGILKIFRNFKFRDIISSLFILLNEKLGFGAYVKKALVFCYLEQPIRKNSCVTISNTIEDTGRMVPVINWIVGTEELESVKTIADCLSDTFSNSDDFYFSSNNISIQEMSSGAHHAGTMRIGDNAQEGVVDGNLRVFGTKNLYVCDLSILPNYGNSNPTYTLAAFSARLANYLIATQKNDLAHQNGISE